MDNNVIRIYRLRRLHRGQCFTMYWINDKCIYIYSNRPKNCSPWWMQVIYPMALGYVITRSFDHWWAFTLIASAHRPDPNLAYVLTRENNWFNWWRGPYQDQWLSSSMYASTCFIEMKSSSYGENIDKSWHRCATRDAFTPSADSGRTGDNQYHLKLWRWTCPRS